MCPGHNTYLVSEKISPRFWHSCSKPPVRKSSHAPLSVSPPCGRALLRKAPLSVTGRLRTLCQLLLRLADFCCAHEMRLQKPERCATHSSLFRPQDVVAVRAPAGGAKCQPVGKGQVGGKEKPGKTSPYHKLSAEERTCTCLPGGRWHVASATCRRGEQARQTVPERGAKSREAARNNRKTKAPGFPTWEGRGPGVCAGQA